MGTVQMKQTALFQEAEDMTVTSGDFDDMRNIDQQGRWSGGESMELVDGESLAQSLQNDYAIPADELRAVFVFSAPTDEVPGFTVRLNGDEVDTVAVNAFSTSADQFDLIKYTTTTLNDSELAAGSQTIEIEIDDTELDEDDNVVHVGGELHLDFIHIYDDRFSYNQDDITPVDGVVTGWEAFPESQMFEFEAVSSVEQVIGARLEVVIDDTTGEQALHVRNDTSDPYITQSNTDTLITDFPESGQELQAAVTLGRYDSGTESGQFGDRSQALDSFELRADLEDTPTLIDKSYHGNLVDILNRIAEAGDYIWEVRRDDGEYTVEWAQAGQRLAGPGTYGDEYGVNYGAGPDTFDPSRYVDFSGKHTIEDSYEKVIVFGASEFIRNERFTVTTDFGNLTGLDETFIVEASETVYDPMDNEEFTRGVDYNMAWQGGSIELISGGNMSLNKEYAIDYDRKTRGEYQLPGTSDPRTAEVQIPEAGTDLECEQLALAIIQRVQDPLEEVTATISDWDPRWPLIEALRADNLPFDGPLVVRGVNDESRGGSETAKLRLGSRKSIQAEVQDLRNELEAIQARV